MIGASLVKAGINPAVVSATHNFRTINHRARDSIKRVLTIPSNSVHTPLNNPLENRYLLRRSLGSVPVETYR